MRPNKQRVELPPRLTIKSVKRVDIPTRFIFIDTESEKVDMGGVMIKHVLRLGHAIYWQRPSKGHKEKVEHFDYKNSLDLWSWVTSKVTNGKSVYLFAHNVTFDFLVLDGFRLLTTLDFTLKSIYNKFSTTIMRFTNEKRNIIIADTMNFYPVKLDEIGKSLGINKIEVNFDKATDEELAERCRVDTEIVYHAVRRLIDRLLSDDLGPFRTTAPSMASSIFRYKFMKHDIVTCHIPEVVAFEKDAYTGGYVAAHRLVIPGSPELYRLDVNSMYPSVMRDNKFPTRIVEFADNVPVKIAERFTRSNSVIARVTLNTDEALYPHRSTGGVIYPVGEFEATLTTASLVYAFANGHVKQVHKIAVYEDAPIFREYVEYMTDAKAKSREAGDVADATFYKTMANVLYGKFGQSATRSDRIGDAPVNEFAAYDAFDAQTGQHWKEFHAGGSVVFIYEDGEARYTHYGIAAHVTDFARMKLFSMARLAGKEHHFYSDTDSLIVDRVGLERLRPLLDHVELGKLKVEDTGELMVTWSKKDYLFGTLRKIKGMQADKERRVKNVFSVLQTVSIYGAAKRNLAEGAFWMEVNKRHNPYMMGVNINQEGEVAPLSLPDEDYKLGDRIYTKAKVKGIAKRILNKKQMNALSEWL